jgi:shikimate dehydrogenase
LSGRTIPGPRIAGVIGWPIGHSRSPALHQAAFRAAGIDGAYAAFEVPPDRLGEALRGVGALGLLGVNVTVPHKTAAMAHLDEVDDLSRVIGAINTVVVGQDRRLSGTNTDAIGFYRALGRRLRELSLRPKRALLLGAGGSARAVTMVLRERDIPVAVVARNVDAAGGLVELGASEVVPWTDAGLARAIDGVDLVIDATSTGLDADRERALPAAIPLDRLRAGALVCSLIYHREPALLAAARERGLPTMDGGAMLVHQAAAAFKLFTGVDADTDAMFAALRA